MRSLPSSSIQLSTGDRSEVEAPFGATQCRASPRGSRGCGPHPNGRTCMAGLLATTRSKVRKSFASARVSVHGEQLQTHVSYRSGLPARKSGGSTRDDNGEPYGVLIFASSPRNLASNRFVLHKAQKRSNGAA